jgi:hypothetical protein
MLNGNVFLVAVFQFVSTGAPGYTYGQGIQGRRWSENRGVPVLFGGHNLPLLVEIGLTDLPKLTIPIAIITCSIVIESHMGMIGIFNVSVQGTATFPVEFQSEKQRVCI